jgi:cytochrome c
VIVQGDQLLVSRFRSAEVITVDATGSMTARAQVPGIPASPFTGTSFSPTIAWRTAPNPVTGGVHVLHQVAADGTVVISQPGGYGSGDQGGGGCSATIVQAAVSELAADGTPMSTTSLALTNVGVAVDMADDGVGNLAIASAGSDSLFTLSAQNIEVSSNGNSGNPCLTPNAIALPGQPVAVAHVSTGFVVQIRELTPGSGQGPALAFSDGQTVTGVLQLPGATMANTGHYLFHHNASATSTIACASCHAEGHEDGHTWIFDTEGERRTQTVSGGVLATAPLHWDGSMNDLTDIMHEVFERRMGGDPSQATSAHVDAFAQWLNTIPAYAASPTGTAAQIAHGQQLFKSASCDNCHSGAHFTNNKTLDVGTGQAFQVPTLIGVAARAPFMHDGCASSLADRFDANAACNGGQAHGLTQSLAASDITDLVAYLETL